jgi:hypothetical protein
MDTGKVLIYDYTPSNGVGRQSGVVLDTYANLAVFGPNVISVLGSQQGTPWLNDSRARWATSELFAAPDCMRISQE